jgi:hypothetical protein
VSDAVWQVGTDGSTGNDQLPCVYRTGARGSGSSSLVPSGWRVFLNRRTLQHRGAPAAVTAAPVLDDLSVRGRTTAAQRRLFNILADPRSSRATRGIQSCRGRITRSTCRTRRSSSSTSSTTWIYCGRAAALESAPIDDWDPSALAAALSRALATTVRMASMTTSGCSRCT